MHYNKLGKRKATYVGNVEEVLRSNDVSRRNSHDIDSSRLVGGFGLPVDNHTLSSLALFSVVPVLVTHGTPFEVLHTVNLDALLVEQTHPGELVNLNRLSSDNLGDIRVIRRPLECGPAESGLFITISLVVGERPERSGGLDVPDDVLVFLIFGAERFSERKTLVGPSDEVVFTRGELDESNSRVGESEDVDTDRSIESRSRPKRDTDSVQGGEVGTEG